MSAYIGITMTILLNDTFNKKTISKHRTVMAAVMAAARHSRMVKRLNGPGSYIPTQIVSTDGTNIQDEVTDAVLFLHTFRK